MIGKKIQNYEIISLIGEGGMGNVYLAENKEVGRRVAIKIILPHLAKHEHVRDRFIIEAKTMSRLQHVNIITLYDYIANDEGLFLIMEYVDGDPLDDYIHNIGKAIDEDLAIEVTKQVLSACDHAHANGVVHRDIKPGNIIINKEGTVKILDFGIAKIIDEEVSKLTKTGLQIGTVYYMSPEQVQGGEITAQTDIYSIGVTLYQMVTAINPYKQESTEFQIYKKIVGEPLPDVREIDPTLSPFIHEVIQKATKKNPSDRFKNCQDFSEMLEKKDAYRAVEDASAASNANNERTDQNKGMAHMNESPNYQVKGDGAPSQPAQQPGATHSSTALRNVPNASGALTCGIIGLVFSVLGILGIIGFILCIIAAALGGSALSKYERNPELYRRGSYSNARAGVVLGIIGMSLFLLMVAIFAIALNL